MANKDLASVRKALDAEIRAQAKLSQNASTLSGRKMAKHNAEFLRGVVDVAFGDAAT